MGMAFMGGGVPGFPFTRPTRLCVAPGWAGSASFFALEEMEAVATRKGWRAVVGLAGSFVLCQYAVRVEQALSWVAHWRQERSRDVPRSAIAVAWRVGAANMAAMMLYEGG